jgi:hypothetical protein
MLALRLWHWDGGPVRDRTQYGRWPKDKANDTVAVFYRLKWREVQFFAARPAQNVVTLPRQVL